MRVFKDVDTNTPEMMQLTIDRLTAQLQGLRTASMEQLSSVLSAGSAGAEDKIWQPLVDAVAGNDEDEEEEVEVEEEEVFEDQVNRCRWPAMPCV